MKKPVKPYESFADYVLKNSDNKTIKCDRCSGHKYIICPHAVPDPVEGYREALRIQCEKCQGSGILTLDQALELYEKVLDEYYQELSDYEHGNVLMESIMQKLTDEELDFLSKKYDISI